MKSDQQSLSASICDFDECLVFQHEADLFLPCPSRFKILCNRWWWYIKIWRWYFPKNVTRKNGCNLRQGLCHPFCECRASRHTVVSANVSRQWRERAVLALMGRCQQFVSLPCQQPQRGRVSLMSSYCFVTSLRCVFERSVWSHTRVFREEI